MDKTRASLLVRLKNRSDAGAWSDFYRLYPPLIYRYARARGLSQSDAEEIRDQCLAVLVAKIRTFEYDRAKGGFKNWLYRVASGKMIDMFRKHRCSERTADSSDLKFVPDPAPGPDELWERQWRKQHLRHALGRVQKSVPEPKYEIFRLLLLDECKTGEVCERLGVTPAQVYKAKYFMLQRVREILKDVDPDLGV